MSLSRESIEHLIDLVEIKLGAFTVYGIDDGQELEQLRNTRAELLAMRENRPMPHPSAEIVRLSAYR